MRVAGRLAGDGPQPETLRRVETRAFDPAVIERKALALAVFEIELTIIHSGQGLVDKRLDAGRVHPRALKEQRVGGGEISHLQLREQSAPIWSRPPFRGRRKFIEPRLDIDC